MAWIAAMLTVAARLALLSRNWAFQVFPFQTDFQGEIFMANAVFAVAYSDVPGFAAGTVLDHVAVSISDTSAIPPTVTTQNVAPGTASVTFANLDVGSYTYTITNQDAANATLGSVVTGSFTVSAPATISLSLATGATVTVA